MSEQLVTAVGRLTAMRKIQKDYCAAAMAMYQDSAYNSVGQFLGKMFMGSSRFDSDPIHMDYFSHMEETVTALAAALAALPEAEKAEGEQIAAEAVDLVIAPPEEDLGALSFILLADDQQMDKLLPDLATQRLRELNELFTAQPERYCAVPSQENSHALLQKELKARGEILPEPTFLQKLKKKLGIF